MGTKSLQHHRKTNEKLRFWDEICEKHMKNQGVGTKSLQNHRQTNEKTKVRKTVEKTNEKLRFWDEMCEKHMKTQGFWGGRFVVGFLVRRILCIRV